MRLPHESGEAGGDILMIRSSNWLISAWKPKLSAILWSWGFVDLWVYRFKGIRRDGGRESCVIAMVGWDCSSSKEG